MLERKVRILDPRSDYPETAGRPLIGRVRVWRDQTMVPEIDVASGKVGWRFLSAEREHMLEEAGFLKTAPDGTYTELHGFCCLQVLPRDLAYLQQGGSHNKLVVLTLTGPLTEQSWIVSTSRCAKDPLRQVRIDKEGLEIFFFPLT